MGRESQHSSLALKSGRTGVILYRRRSRRRRRRRRGQLLIICGSATV
jgi:hypothetical protein